MSKYGLYIACLYGEQLPAFNSLPEAENALFSERDHYLRLLETLSAATSQFRADYSAQSLKHLEKWYFALLDLRAFDAGNVSQADFEIAMGYYFGEVARRNDPRTRWLVSVYPFMPDRYEIKIGY